MKANPLYTADKLSMILNRCAYIKLFASREADKERAEEISRKITAAENKIRILLKKAAAQNLHLKPSVEKYLNTVITKIDKGLRQIERSKKISSKITLLASHTDEIIKLVAKIAN